MAEFNWQEDSDAKSIAIDILKKYDSFFQGMDLSLVRFVRILGKKKGKLVKVVTPSFPCSLDTPYLYYILIDDTKWNQLEEAQRNLVVFSSLYEIAPGGTDGSSNNYGKKRKRDIDDFDVVISAAGGRYDWKTIGVEGIHDILSDENKEKILDTITKEELAIQYPEDED